MEANATLPVDPIEQPELWQTWFYGMVIVTFSNFISPLGIMLVPLLSKTFYERCMTFLVALGIGAMSGSCLFILLPHAFNITQVNEMEYLRKCWLIVGSLYGFFCVDRFLQWILEIRRRRNDHHRVHMSTLDALKDHHDQSKRKTSIIVRKEPRQIAESRIDETKRRSEEPKSEKEKNGLKEEIELSAFTNSLVRSFSTRKQMAIITAEPIVDEVKLQTPNGSVQSLQIEEKKENQKQIKFDDNNNADPQMDVSIQIHEHNVLEEKGQLEVASVAYMILFGSSANNLVDGMSIGAAFSDSIIRGIGIGLAVLSQQLPQELGTLAILVNSGLGIRRTLLLNMVPILLNYVGFVLGVFLDNFDDSYDSFIFSVSAGMYLYVFLGVLLPEIREQFNEQLRESFPEALLTTFLQIVGILCGLIAMFVMNLNNDEI